MISSELKECISTLTIASKIRNVKLREKFLIDQFKKNSDLFKAIKEIALNLIQENIPLTDTQKRSLKKHKHQIVDIVKDKAKTRRKKHIAQSGGYLPILIPTVISLISELIDG